MHKVIFPFFLCCGISIARVFDGQIQLSPYFDSNVQESLNHPNRTIGIKVRGNINDELSGSGWRIYGYMLTQTFLDTRFNNESKLIVRPELGFAWEFLPKARLVGRLTHFQKTFFWQSRSYQWTEYGASLKISPLSRFASAIEYFTKLTTFKIDGNIRYHENNLQFRGEYKVTSRFILEGIASTSIINYENYRVQMIQEDVPIIHPDLQQKDESINGSIHVRYRRKLIVGAYLEYESVTSNNILSEYDFIGIRAYLSGRWGQSTFYHLLFQRVDKNYAKLEGLTIYRDPEETIQNRTYIQVERLLKGGTVAFIQLSLLQNETILNQQYYDKMMVELGIKFDL